MTPAEHIDKQIASFPDWRGKYMTKLREQIHEAAPLLKEEWKWDTGVWTHNGLVCAVSAFKDHVKINFFKGVSLRDPHKLLNAGLESKRNRAIDFSENDPINDHALADLIREAVSLNIK